MSTCLTRNQGNPLTVTDPRGNVTINTYDTGRRVMTTTTPATQAALGGVKTAYTYDLLNRRIRATDPLNLLDPEGLAARLAVEQYTSEFVSGLYAGASQIASTLYTNTFLKMGDDIGRAYNRFLAEPGAEVLTAIGSIPQTRATVAVAGAATTWGRLAGPAIGTEQAWSGVIRSGAVPEGGMTAYRVWGGGSAEVGSWLSPIAPSSSTAARSLLALPTENTAAFVSPVRIPGGTQIQFGTAADAFRQPGGGTQIQLLQRIPTSNFGPATPLPP